MSTRFLQVDLWSEVTQMAHSASRRMAAVAYMGAGATKMLPLKRGDILVTDMSIHAVKAGQVNPYEIAIYLKRGVEVHTYAGLHAKVFVFDNKAVVGSANASSNSNNNLIEAAVVTTEQKVVRSVRGFVQSLMGEQVTPAYVKSCQSIYKPPRNSSTSRHEGSVLWITYLLPYEFDDYEKRISEKTTPIARTKLRNKRTYIVEPIPLNMSSSIGGAIKENDIVVMLYRDSPQQHMDVYPPSRVAYTKRYTNPITKVSSKFVFIEQPREPNLLDWETFRKTVNTIGKRKATQTMMRKITNPAARQKILSLWDSLHA